LTRGGQDSGGQGHVPRRASWRHRSTRTYARTSFLLGLSTCLFGASAFATDWIEAFHAAPSAEERRAVVAAADTASLTFAELYRVLAAPPPKPPPVETGLGHGYTVGARKERFPYALYLPPDYDASRAYPLVIMLHGTVSRKKPSAIMARRAVDPEFIIGDAIQVFPSSWSEAKWWTPVQAANLDRIIQQLKAELNIDTDRVFLLGWSDGATGGFYAAATDPSPYAAFISVIGYPGVLKGSRVRLDEDIYPINLRSLKILAVNTENDPLYPVEKMRYFVDAFRELEIDIELVADPFGGHDLNALKRAMPKIRSWILDTRRETHPRRLTWQYEAGGRHQRAAWLQVKELVSRDERPDQLEALDGIRGTGAQTGLIELASNGNDIVVSNLGVKRYSLLLSPDQFDFEQPVRLIENGVEVFNGQVRPSKRVLLEYAIRDFDPRRLYGAELEVNN
jgi:dienelactone hydrolase